jgi:tripartite-type tricarboxylate transporter receptor subunit TctC
MKTGKCRGLLLIGVLIIFVFSLTNVCLAAERNYPTRSIDNICLFGAGGQSDRFNRVLSKSLEKYLGQPIVTVNKPGGAGAIGFSYLTRARPDGYTIGVGTLENMIVPTLQGNPYALEDMHVICQIATVFNVLIVAGDSQWKTFQEFIDYAKMNPGVKYGSPLKRSTIYLRMESFNMNTGLKMVGVPFDSGKKVVSAVLGKHVPIGIASLGGSKGLAAAGKLKILFSFESPAAAGLPENTPTLSDFEPSVTDKDIAISQLLIVPSKTPDHIKQLLKRTMVEKVMKDPDFLKGLENLSLISDYVDGDTIMQKKLPMRKAQVTSFYKKMGWLK